MFSFIKISECEVCIATRNVENEIINSYLISNFAAHSFPLKLGTKSDDVVASIYEASTQHV